MSILYESSDLAFKLAHAINESQVRGESAGGALFHLLLLVALRHDESMEQARGRLIDAVNSAVTREAFERAKEIVEISDGKVVFKTVYQEEE